MKGKILSTTVAVFRDERVKNVMATKTVMNTNSDRDHHHFSSYFFIYV